MDEHTVPDAWLRSRKATGLLSCAPTRSKVVTLFLALLELSQGG